MKRSQMAAFFNPCNYFLVMLHSVYIHYHFYMRRKNWFEEYNAPQKSNFDYKYEPRKDLQLEAEAANPDMLLRAPTVSGDKMSNRYESKSRYELPPRRETTDILVRNETALQRLRAIIKKIF